ncbi:phytoene desaturase family protein [Bythopirellula polymerisocia]|uniref:Pyridine nucleotide-disulfide oxidoreductase domain-containing protein 2 n=1 Tax=Bythopirellula polymerisocia TaxID=2528003 RepID=A0A5C6CC72_9BACT|nr:NAD(P)/FAD-dependent oxidoreductase [Bythopirellula polymerisocia]TWU21848.1 Diapolycopene oxygenase [Bythopirellula polymerisocia]
MSRQFDAIIIGAGHNGLTCACYLARAGLKVLVLEQSHTIGGMTVTEEITLPGFKSDLHAFGYQFANLSPVPKELNLSAHGFELIWPNINYSHVFPDGGFIAMHRSLEETVRSIGRYSKKDGETWRRLAGQFVEQKDQITRWMNSPPASLTAATLQLAQMPHGMDEYRFELQSTRSWVAEQFEADETRLFIATFASHASVSPDDVGGAHLAWLFTSLIQAVGNRVVRGGMHNLPLALAAYLRSKGGQIRTGARVNKIVVKDNRAVGVRLVDGEEIGVKQIVASNADPRQLIVDFLGPEHIDANLISKMQQYEWGDAYMAIYLALDGPLNYLAGADADRSAYVHPTPPTLDYLSSVYTECRGGLLPAAPLVLMCNDSAIDPDRAPVGKNVMKLVVNNVPYDIKGDATGKIHGRTWDAAKEAYADHLIDLITKTYVPNLRDRILRRVVHSPVDMERAIPSAVRGTVTHGAFLPYQSGAQRPLPGLGQYRMPVPNVYLCGSGSHPGGGVSMAPGRNSAQVILAALQGNDIAS